MGFLIAIDGLFNGNRKAGQYGGTDLQVNGLTKTGKGEK